MMIRSLLLSTIALVTVHAVANANTLDDLNAKAARADAACAPALHRAMQAAATLTRCQAISDRIESFRAIRGAAYVAGGDAAYQRARQVTDFSSDDTAFYRQTCDSAAKFDAVEAAARNAETARERCQAAAWAH